MSSGSNGNLQTAALPAGHSGTLYVQVLDTDNTQGNRALDTVFIDHLFIRVDNQPVTAPADPSGLGAVVVAHNQVDLTWTDNATDETAFEVERAESGGGFSLLATLGANSTSYSDTTTSGSTPYDYRVRAIKGGTPSGYSNEVSVTTPTGPAITLSATGYKVRGVHHIDLTWSNAGGADVEIHRNTTVFSTVNDGFHTDNTGNKGGATYTYQVCEAGTSTCSNIVTVVF